MDEKILEIRHLSKAFGKNVVLRDIDFSVKQGDVTCIIGASGSGKSTLLRCINFLEEPTTGDIIYHGKSMMEQRINEAAYRAKVGMVFQSFNLFNNMTVLQNCMVGQEKVLKKDKETARRNAMYFLDKVGMAPYINAKPRQLSGGQKQRVAIARALAMEPEVLLFDEPTSALDIAHQVDVLALVHRLSQERGLTVIAVLHDINMAARYCDYLVALRGGEMIAQGTPAEIMRGETLEMIYGIPMGILPHPAGAAPVSFVY